MYLLAIGLVFLFTIRRRVAFAEEGRVAQAAKKAVGLLSIVIWLGVAALARLIMMIPWNTFEWLVGSPGLVAGIGDSGCGMWDPDPRSRIERHINGYAGLEHR